VAQPTWFSEQFSELTRKFDGPAGEKTWQKYRMNRMSPDDIKLILEMRRDGYTYDAIAEEMDSCNITIKRICLGDTYGAEKTTSATGVRGMTIHDARSLWRMRDEGKTYKEMCELGRVSSKTLVKLFKLPRPAPQ